ncbi:MAG: NADH-quinone oxidoreductase subunit J [Pseudanabaenaceae cyanobacterium SKYGB_i_bin29]|nr:NADH-quinone oxidoreductase subunit J [Pseudanabaenaceae cyanobacterium SKYG29]MDW8422430.1 NADH-quinone oxidoreductase subunit J [Pseudanabaenaceae cyanobacterium SKYGB_i_bin29]
MKLAQGVEIVSLLVLTVMVVAAALGVVLSPSIVYAAFLLGLVFLGIAGMYLMLNADFVAAAQVLIYVGAVNVLILFAIMLVNRRKVYREVKLGAVRQLVAITVCVSLFALLLYTNLNTVWLLTPEVKALPSVIVALGQHFFNEYLLPFELASVLLLVALIGAIILARREFIPDRQVENLELVERPKELIGVGEE